MACGKLFALAAGSLCLGIHPAAADYSSEVLSDGPLAYYRFDDGVATDDLDSAQAINLGSLGTAGNGSFDGTNTRGVAGAVSGDTAIAFAQAAPTNINYVGSVIIPNNAALNPDHTGTNPFTVECWVKPNTNQSSLLSPVCSMTGDTGRSGYMIYQNTNAWQLRMGNGTSTTPALTLNAPANSVTAGAWQHLVVTYTGGATGTATLYVNGASVASGSPSGTGYQANTTFPFRIGAFNAPNRTFDGTVDEVAFFASELSASRIAARYAEATANPAGYQAHVLADSPVGYWRLNEAPFVPRTPPVADNAGSLGNSADAAYYAGSKNTATGPNAAGTYQGFGASNSALALHTANGYVGTPLPLLNNLTEFTVLGWVKRGATKSTRGGYFGQNDLLEFGDAGGGTQIEAWIDATGGNVVTSYPMPDDTWGLITLTGNAAGCRMAVYYYDTVDAEHKVVTATRGGAGNFGTRAFNFNIGGGGIFNPTGDFFRGEIDEVAVFDKALSPGRIQQLYDSAVGTVPPIASAPVSTPANGIVPEGKPYSLTVDPAGTPPFTYQWLKNGVAIEGATDRTYSVASAVVNDPVAAPFSYSVRITGTGPSGPESFTTDPTDIFVVPDLLWVGNDATNPTWWDIDTTPNWKPRGVNTPYKYTDDFSVTFDNSGIGTTVEFQVDVEPQETTFDFDAPKHYTLNGEFGILGGGAMTKTGSGTLTLNSSNPFFGDLAITGGTVEVSAADNLGGGGPPMTLNGGTIRATASHTLSRKPLIPGGAEGTIAVNDGIQLVATGGLNGGGTLVKQGPGVLRFEGYGANSFSNGAILVEEGTLAMAGGLFNGDIGLASILVESGATLLQPAGAYHALGGAWTDTPAITLEEGATYTANQENYLSIVNMTGATVNGTADLRSDYNFLLHVYPSATLSTWGVTLNGVVTPINIVVDDGPLAVDFLLSGNVVNTQPLNKTGTGTMAMTGANSTISGLTTIAEGTLTGTGTLAGPLTVSAGAAIAPGAPVGTFAAGTITLGGTYQCEISGAACDTLRASGDLVLSAGSSIQITAVNPTALFYPIATYGGSFTDNGTVVTGVPTGYEVVTAFNSVMIAQIGLSFTPVLTTVPGVGVGTLAASEFETDNGGFTVSASVTAETDWAHVTGSWQSPGQETQLETGSNVSYLTSPPLTLTKTGVFGLTFSHRHIFELYPPAESYDGGAVEFSVNGGPFQPVPAGAFYQNGYNGTMNPDSSIPLAGQKCFLGTSAGHPGFITSGCTLGAGAAGDIIRVRFMVAYDWATSGSTDFPDWEITSYQITEGATGITMTWPVGVIEYSDNLQPPWTALPDATSPMLIDTSLAPSRFFRVRP